MIIGDRLREMREAKKLSQGDLEKRAGLFRCYISRVENGHTVPAIEPIEKFARALKVPIVGASATCALSKRPQNYRPPTILHISDTFMLKKEWPTEVSPQHHQSHA
jgi:transcriptional regulator with XRE-family HTH domain